MPLDDASDKVESRIRGEITRIDLQQRTLHLEQALEQLEETRREVIILRRYEELTFPEIAKRLDRSPDACRVLHARAMADLATHLKALSDSGQD